MTPGRAPELVQGLMHPLPAPLWGMVNVSISFRTLAMGERVGNAGSDPFRSPMKRCSHARFPPCESHGHALRGGLSAKAVEITTVNAWSCSQRRSAVRVGMSYPQRSKLRNRLDPTDVGIPRSQKMCSLARSAARRSTR
jgi:hypothetical protein